MTTMSSMTNGEFGLIFERFRQILREELAYAGVRGKVERQARVTAGVDGLGAWLEHAGALALPTDSHGRRYCDMATAFRGLGIPPKLWRSKGSAFATEMRRLGWTPTARRRIGGVRTTPYYPPEVAGEA